ncbi:MAG: thiol-disulfide isomerase [Deltaproteobacteria bacterium]|nr:thiol-disulfide isomerase [Deltaproteobacteria bacterium]
MTDEPRNRTADFEQALKRRGEGHYVLRLYITGTTPRSVRAIASIRRICEEHLKGRYEIEVIDLFEHPELAAPGQVVAAPTLVKELPPPLRKLIGDLSDVEQVLKRLDIVPKTEAEKEHDRP